MSVILPETGPMPGHAPAALDDARLAAHSAAAHLPWCDADDCYVDTTMGFGSVLYMHSAALLDDDGFTVRLWRSIEVARETGDVVADTEEVTMDHPPIDALTSRQAAQLGAALTAAAVALATSAR